MRHSHTGPGYSVVVEGAFVAPRLWFIHAAICGRRENRVARRALLQGIGTVSRRGWRLGARNVRVVIDEDREVAGFFEVLRRPAASGLVA